MDISHNSPTATLNVQFFAQATPNYTYLTGGPGDTFGRSTQSTFSPDWAIAPGGPTTIRLPISQMTPEEQAYIVGIGMDVREHTAAGNVTWTVSDLRTVGTPLASRVVATHNAGTSENGLNGAYLNFDRPSVLGNDGSGQSGLSVNGGALEWTDVAGGAGAAISWGNGTIFNGNNYNERPASFDNYNQVTFRVKAADPLNQGGTLSVQSYFQNENYSSYQVPGTQDLPIDGQYHDLTFSLTGITGLRSVDAFGFNLGTHPNNALVSVDEIRFSAVQGVQGDYNNNGVVDAADYVLWRNGGPLQNEVDAPGTVNAADYTAWRARFGSTSGSGSLSGSSAVPEPGTAACMLIGLVSMLLASRRAI
jgi:hypothetical protein